MKKIFNATKTLVDYNKDLPYTTNKQDAEFMIVGGKKIDLDEFPRLKGIFKTGVGIDNLPFEEAKRRGVKIELPSEQTKEIIYHETASFSVYLMLNFLYQNKGVFEAWEKHNREALQDKKILIMGTGKIGSKVVERLTPFAKVLTYDPTANAEEELILLLQQADVVSLHLPLNQSTQGFFNKEKLAYLKDGALLVNTSRGPIIDEEDLYNELKSKRINAAIDVFWQEPYNGILTTIPSEQLIKTPHIASTCKGFLDGLAADFNIFYKQN
jgi:phosphoglycerate dehydrogenase-like enzyme